MTKPTTQDAPPGTSGVPFRYTARLADDIERRWQSRWEAEATFRALNPGDPGFDPAQPKFFCLDMFPYPSGTGLHVGHPEGYTATDIVSRYRRLDGWNVLHPMGWDAFGLPAEQYAIQTGVHPRITTKKAIDTFRRQLKRFGFSYDWGREFGTIDEDYYRWTQWIWLRAYDAWYDREQDRARPIADLVGEFASGARIVQEDPGCPAGLVGRVGREGDLGSWADLDGATRTRVLSSYRLAYLSLQTVNWCPRLGTALANEEVIDGRSERGGHPVFRKPLRQWMFRITAFADRLLGDLDGLDWPSSTITMQREWIGRSEGAEIDFPLADVPSGAGASIRVYTTRPDTIFGATYMVLAPEHPLVAAMLADPRPGTDVETVRTYVERAINRADVERLAEAKEKTGVDTGFRAVNPANGERIAIWIADYVLMGYGHGAIMAVPAGDERDWDFAKAFGLPIVAVVERPAGVPDDGRPWCGEGTAVRSANDEVSLDGLPTAAAKRAIIEWLERRGLGRRKVNYRLRDWLFSRQRYWGEPFPIVFDEHGDHHRVADAALPVRLPVMDDYEPVEADEPTPLLGKATAWVETTAGEAGVAPDVLPPGSRVTRETNTMPGWAGSCWYYLRFCDPKNDDRFVSREAEQYWMLSRKDGARTTPDAIYESGTHHTGGVDLYIGGAEHAVLHLLYARFWHKILYDLGEVSTPEPVGKLFHQGMITSFAYQRADRSLVALDDVEERADGSFVEAATGAPVTRVGAKMSKSLKNVENPDDVISQFGTDTFRLYEMYMGPLEATKPWNTRDMVGLFRFLQRSWRLVVDEATGECVGAVRPRDEIATVDAGIDQALHRTIEGVTADIENLRFNTAIAKLIELVNTLVAHEGDVPTDVIDRFLVILSPFAPHIAEELWSRLGHDEMIAHAQWPEHDPSLLTQRTVDMPVQILGKVRGRITVSADADANAIEEAALADDRVRDLLEGRTVRKVIVVPGKIVNIVV